MRRHTGSAALDDYEIKRAEQRWEKEQQTLVPGSRIIRLPEPGPVSMMDEDDWNSKKVDRRLARKIAFADVGLTAQGQCLSISTELDSTELTAEQRSLI